MLKKILAILLLLSFLLLAVGCTQTSNQKPTESSSDTSDKTDEEPNPSIELKDTLISGENRYKIIFPEGKKALAIKIQDKLTALDPATVGTIGYYSTQLDTKLEDNGAPEILIGKTNRAASKEAEDNLSAYLDYSITKKGNKIVIFANTDERLEEAVIAFNSGLKLVSDKHVVYSGGDIFSTYDKYDYKALKIADGDIADFSIVLPASADDTQKSFANELWEWIALSTGIKLPVVTDAEAEGEKEILIGATSRSLSEGTAAELEAINDNDFLLKLDNKKLVMGAKNLSGYKRLLSTLKNQFAKNNGVFPENAEIIKNNSINGSTAIFIGNSYIYYGNCVVYGEEEKTDIGYFHQICKQNGDNVTVYDYTFGGKSITWIYENHLINTTEEFRNSIDYVFLSESVRNADSIVDTVNNVANIFPNAKAKIFLNHASSAQSSSSQGNSGLEALKEAGYLIANWGGLVYDVWSGKVDVPDAKCSYKKDSFIVNKEDTHHQNVLSGYITAQMAYSVLTGTSAVGQEYKFCGDETIHPLYSFATFKQKFYNPNSTNFEEIFNSRSDMLGLQALMDQYIAKHN